ncbi:hypothetical protein [uncultured Methylobacterium sp.]|uniref:hypothetical protein n=1 Tax=uncultured Methylobacterium sp. TaxID=157278 RepID=UPI0035CB2921
MTSLLTLERLAIMSNPRQILLSTRIRSSAFFGGVTGVTRMNPAASARCATPIPKTFEIALVLDNTGSMADAGGDGVTKIAALKSAAKTFVNYVFKNPASAAGTKMSIVPFAAAVAVDPGTYRTASWVDQSGKSAYRWTNVTGASVAGFTGRFDIFSKLQAERSGASSMIFGSRKMLQFLVRSHFLHASRHPPRWKMLQRIAIDHS